MQQLLRLQLYPILYLELLVDFNLVTGGQAIGLIGHANHGHQLVEHCIGHALVSSRRGMRGDAVRALVRYAYSDIEHFFGQRVVAPGAMICLMDSQVRLSVAGSFASAFQKLLIQSVLRVTRISS